MTDNNKVVSMANAIDLLEEAKTIAQQLDGIPLHVEGMSNKDRMALQAKRGRLLLFGAHVADLARAEITSQYHIFKGESAPTINL